MLGLGTLLISKGSSEGRVGTEGTGTVEWIMENLYPVVVAIQYFRTVLRTYLPSPPQGPYHYDLASSTAGVKVPLLTTSTYCTWYCTVQYFPTTTKWVIQNGLDRPAPYGN